ncbi:flagellar biosynthesis anti-sigma factor FlgM [Halobacillus litoralis]|uniref:flagellar biosynthesis anti-sigma factor FlgM n=1 Tax=Halobacillus litoralis TaxID=45668 RepID=UPI001CD80FDE|nr:flagellar biosynthesis anti-sigma factor FlgM [Halobacillus litoralis]MCA0971565.1 flagellar biosynthesis anti-sigma factor FlgM [Halobacillus litoralis]
MKIHGPNQSNFNPYQKSIKQQTDMKQQGNRQDKLEISNEAKQMQGKDQPNPARQKRVDQIKHDIESGNYQIDPKLTAQKMIDFWTK